MRVAPRRLRLCAGLVDAAVVIGGIAALVGPWIAWVAAYGRVRGDADEENDEWGGHDRDGDDEPSDLHHPAGEFPSSPQLRAALWGASTGLSVASRNWRGPGFRVVGLRRVDAQTGGIVSVRSALIGALFDQARQTATRPLFRSRVLRQRDRMTALGPQLRAVQRTYPGDPQARKRAMMEFYKANDASPLAGWQLAGPIGSQMIVALGSRRGRTVRDLITGTSVIVDR
jgi:hypothetical protein